MSDTVWVSYDEVVQVGDAAKKYAFAEGDKWIPDSQVSDSRTLKGRLGELHEIEIPVWLAKKEELI